MEITRVVLVHAVRYCLRGSSSEKTLWVKADHSGLTMKLVNGFVEFHGGDNIMLVPLANVRYMDIIPDTKKSKE